MDARRSSLKDVLNEGLKVILEIRSIKKFLAFFFRGVRLLFKHALPSRATHYRNDDEYLDHDVSLSKGYQIPAEEIASAAVEDFGGSVLGMRGVEWRRDLMLDDFGFGVPSAAP